MKLKLITAVLSVASLVFLSSCGSKGPASKGDSVIAGTSTQGDAVTKEFLIGKTWIAEKGHGSAPFSTMIFSDSQVDYLTGKDPYTLKDGVLDFSSFHIIYGVSRDGDGFLLVLSDGTKFKYNAEGGSSTTQPATTEAKTTETKPVENTTSSSTSSTPKFNVGDKIEVYDAAYEKKWFAADILKVKDGKYYIHYHGYDSKWDIWATENHVRAAH